MSIRRKLQFYLLQIDFSWNKNILKKLSLVSAYSHISLGSCLNPILDPGLAIHHICQGDQFWSNRLAIISNAVFNSCHKHRDSNISVGELKYMNIITKETFKKVIFQAITWFPAKCFPPRASKRASIFLTKLGVVSSLKAWSRLFFFSSSFSNWVLNQAEI